MKDGEKKERMDNTYSTFPIQMFVVGVVAVVRGGVTAPLLKV